MKHYDSHPYADIFKLHDGKPIEELAESIKAHGQKVPALLFPDRNDGGKIKLLDGRRRSLACTMINTELITKPFKGTERDALVEAKILNKHRRHSTPSERAMEDADFDAEMKKVLEDEAKNGVPIGTPSKSGGKKKRKRSVGRAKKVLSEGIQAIQDAVRSGVVTVSDAESIVGEPPDTQAAALDAVVAGTSKTLKEAVAAIKVANPPEPLIIKDEVAHIVPEPCRAAFESLAEFKKMDGLVRQIQTGLDAMARLPGGEELARTLQATKSSDKITHRNENLNALKRDLRGTRPYSICPWCKGFQEKECKGCSGHGWVSKLTWDNSEDKVKARLA